jgi:hypothetical protein
VNKSQNDTKIAGLLNELRKSFPRLDDWTSIYPTLAMKTLVTEVYKQIIDFARHTSVYFTRFTSKSPLFQVLANVHMASQKGP